MICASARGGDDQRRSSSGSTQHHRVVQQTQHQQVGSRRQCARKKSEDAATSDAAAEREQQRSKRRKQRPTAGRARQEKGGGCEGKGEEEGIKGEGGGGKKKGKEVDWRRWDAWESRVRGGVVGVDDTLRRSIARAERFEAIYDADPQPIATGMFTNIRRCHSRATGKEFAAKFSQRNRCGTDCTSEIYHEVALLSIVAQCPNVVHLCDVFETPQEIILVLEYAPGGDLQSIIDENMVPFESDVVEFVKAVLEGLEFIHKHNIAHLDIKPQNLVMMGAFPDCDIKLCDFEISRAILQGESIREILGTPDYVAPEILHYEPISTAADMWSLGVTAYVLLTGFSPFGGDTDQETFCNISKAELDFPDELFEDVSAQAKDFISKLLVREPSLRPSASESLKHPWISQQSNRSSGPSGRRFLSISAAPSPAASCKDLSLLRKYLSKSREALFERVAGSNLRKALSRSRDRLCGSHLSLVARSRDTLHNAPTTAARRRSRDELCTLLSRSHETLGLRDSMQNVGTRPLAGFYGSMVDTNTNGGLDEANVFISNHHLPFNNPTTPTSNGSVSPLEISAEDAGEGAVEDSDSEGTLRDWKEESWASSSDTNTNAKICDSDNDSDKEKTAGCDEISTEKKEQDSEKLKEEESKDETTTESKDTLKMSTEQVTGWEANNLATNAGVDDDTNTNEGNETPSSEAEEPRYTVAQLISVFNKRWESSQQPGPNRTPITLPMTQDIPAEKEVDPQEVPREKDEAEENKMEEAGGSKGDEAGVSKGDEAGVSKGDEAGGSKGNEMEELKGRKGSGGEEELLPSPTQYLRSGSLSSETSGYETPSDASSMASWEEGISKRPKSPVTEKAQESNAGSHLTERRGSAQGLIFHHTWGMKVCDGSYSRAMSRFGNVDRNSDSKGKACKPLGEQTVEKTQRKCKPLVRPFL